MYVRDKIEVMKMDYLLCTNIYNERDRIEDTFKMVSEFSLQPKKWLWIVDGSTDGSELEIERCAFLYDINVECFILPPKDTGSLRTLGKAYNAAFDGLGTKDEEYDFMMVIDVDNKFYRHYPLGIARMFSNHENMGVISGYNKDSPKLKMPQGNGKAIRWEIVQDIHQFWEPAIDTMLNIKTQAWGYDWGYLTGRHGLIEGPPANRNITSAGAHHAGWFWYYVSGKMWEAFKRMGYRMLKGRHGIAFMRGFLEGRRIGSKSDDPDVIRFYGREE